MAQKKLSKEDEKKEKARFIQKRYADRLTVLRLAREYNQKKDVANAVKAYVKYIDALLKYFEVNEDNLSPLIFKKEENIHEIMLISQVYWDLARLMIVRKSLRRNVKDASINLLSFLLVLNFNI